MTRLRDATREERMRLYSQLYDELFARVADHPHTAKQAPGLARERTSPQIDLVADFIADRATFLEIGAGDCALSFAVAPKVERVYAVEVSQTIAAHADTPANFELLLTNGIDMPISDGTVTVAYSNQLMEHLHPDDAIEQVTNIHRVLGPDGVYICLTPNALLHDFLTNPAYDRRGGGVGDAAALLGEPVDRPRAQRSAPGAATNCTFSGSGSTT